jgi:transcriptional regulator with XRE-family HTH domain
VHVDKFDRIATIEGACRRCGAKLRRAVSLPERSSMARSTIDRVIALWQAVVPPRDHGNYLAMAAPRPPFAAALVRAREAADLTQGQAAGWVGVSTVTYRRWESGTGEPAASQLASLAAAFGTTANDLLAGTPLMSGAGLMQRLLAVEAEVARLRERLDESD